MSGAFLCETFRVVFLANGDSNIMWKILTLLTLIFLGCSDNSDNYVANADGRETQKKNCNNYLEILQNADKETKDKHAKYITSIKNKPDLEKGHRRVLQEYDKYYDEAMNSQIKTIGMTQAIDLLNYRLSCPKPENLQVTETVLIRQLILKLIENNDHEKLARLLASHAIEKAYKNLYIEYYITFLASKSSNDYILVLFDACAMSEDDNIKQILFNSAKRAFVNIEDKNITQEQYMNNCREWYVKNKDSLFLNSDYSLKANIHQDSAKKIPLFTFNKNKEAKYRLDG